MESKIRKEELKRLMGKMWALKFESKGKFKKLNNKIFRLTNIDEFGRVTFTWLNKDGKVKHMTTSEPLREIKKRGSTIKLIFSNNDAKDFIVYYYETFVKSKYEHLEVVLVDPFIETPIRDNHTSEVSTSIEHYDVGEETTNVTFADIHDLIFENSNIKSNRFNIKRVVSRNNDDLGDIISIVHNIHERNKLNFVTINSTIDSNTFVSNDGEKHFEELKVCKIFFDDNATFDRRYINLYVVIKFVKHGLIKDGEVKFCNNYVNIGFPNGEFNQSYDMSCEKYGLHENVMNIEKNRLDENKFINLMYIFNDVFPDLLNSSKCLTGDNNEEVDNHSTTLEVFNEELFNNLKENNPSFIDPNSSKESMFLEDSYEIELVSFKNTEEKNDYATSTFSYYVKYFNGGELSLNLRIDILFITDMSKYENVIDAEIVISNINNHRRCKIPNFDIANYKSYASYVDHYMFDMIRSKLKFNDVEYVAFIYLFYIMLNNSVE